MLSKPRSPRAIQAAKANPGSANSAISTGELLRALRLRAKVTQAEAARAAGVSQVQVAHWENSGGTPSGTQLHALCFAYRVNDDELLFLTTRGWKAVEPLPKDMGALECVAGDVEFEGSTDNRSGLYLALDARFQEMHRAGKLSDDEASRVHGHYGLWLLTRFDELHLAYQIGKPGIESLLQGRETLRWMQQETLNLAIQCHLRFARIGDAIAILSGSRAGCRVLCAASGSIWPPLLRNKQGI